MIQLTEVEYKALRLNADRYIGLREVFGETDPLVQHYVDVHMSSTDGSLDGVSPEAFDTRVDGLIAAYNKAKGRDATD